ncbi:tRNA-dihydrouridine(16/17) synthase [NAD(P)(+)]-like isoform X2 [Clavelina lepadiformis]|uniref:SAM-dependent MTase TRM10-type domain-containing protein n=1 Tax=Clavelina lepadiformis TaxID=159417 RepID=A0ABP0F551_CLALP
MIKLSQDCCKSSFMNDGYMFYKNVLKSPKYIVAPMVAQSELAWRMMARKHGAHLCYTPMISANTFLTSKHYRHEVLQDLSCAEDRPLIVQFCANQVEVFVEAALIVQSYCDGVDLNLGCPQHIARRGFFGSFLQDEWTLLHDIISEARKRLSVGVTAKIRVFPEISKTVEYAQMLEKAGCHILTVHGRTRDQKRENTGLASWSHIKAVKENTKIPVFSNGNIRYFRDVENCLQETGVDGVMVAEGHLTNPMIFKDVHPNVFDIIEEYLEFVNLYPTEMSFVRTHVFNLLSHTLQKHRQMRGMLGGALSIATITRICDKLKRLCHEENESEQLIPESGMSHWMCQPYTRPHASKGGFLTDDTTKNDSTTVSKSAMKKQKKKERNLYKKHQKRLEEHRRRREREKEKQKALLDTDVHKDRILRSNERKQAILDRMEEVMQNDSQSVVVCLDLTWTHKMNDKEINKLSSQLGRMYGSNRCSENPAHLYFSGFERDGHLWNECVRKHDGFESYKIEMESKPYNELFDSSDIVYLTPDAALPLESVEAGKVYVLGGLVDETVTKKLTLDKANKLNIETRRLPVQEYMIRSGHHANYSTVYCVNQVFDILLTYHETKDWRKALHAGVPPRKGYIFEERHDS